MNAVAQASRLLPPLKARPLLAVACAALVYGLCNFISGKFLLPGSTFVELRPQVALPMFVGLIYGPIAGFIVGSIGDSLGYVLQGLGPFHAVNWSIGNGFIGAIPGLGRFVGLNRIASIRDYLWLMLLVILASFLPIIFASLIDTLRQSVSFRESWYTLILPASITDAIFGMLFIPGLMHLSRRLAVTVETRTMLLINYLLIATVLVTFAASTWSMWSEDHTRGFVLSEFYTIGLLCLGVLLLGLCVSAFLARTVTGAVVRLVQAALAITEGRYRQAPDLDAVARRQDELGQLAAVFQTMLREVSERENRLRSEVLELRIEIDKTKTTREVARITSSDYFQELRAKAKELRKAR